MLLELIQKKRFSFRKYTLYEDRISVEIKTVRHITRYEVKLENIGNSLVFQTANTLAGKVFFVICIAIPIILTALELTIHIIGINMLLLIYILWFGIALINYLSEHQDDIIVTGGQETLVFYRNIPQESKVLEFINEMMAASKRIIKYKYTKIESYIPEEEFINRLQWLLDREIITVEELTQLREEYKLKKIM